MNDINNFSKKQNLKILVVEDDEINQLIAGHILNSINCDFELARDGDEAYKKATSNIYDLILMDCKLPYIDGFEATINIRNYENSISNSKHTPIVALTSMVMTNDKQKCLDVGMNDYIAKPLKKEKILEAINKWCFAHEFETGNW